MRSDCRPVTFTKEQGVVPQYTKGFCKTIQLLYDYTGSLKENYCLLVCGLCRCTTKYCTKECSIHCPIIALASEKLDAHWLIIFIIISFRDVDLDLAMFVNKRTK